MKELVNKKRWTYKTPSNPGLYWLCRVNGNIKGKAIIVQLSRGKFIVDGLETDLALYGQGDKLLWYGPVTLEEA